MARIKPLGIDEVNEKSKEIFHEFLEHRGNIPNMFRTLAYRSDLLETAYEHFNTVLNGGIVNIKLKEMVAVKVSQLNECQYWLSSHTALAKRFGVSEESVEALIKGTNEPGLFSEAELVALEYAEAVTLGSTAVSESLWNKVKQQFTTEEIIELTCLIGVFNYFNRFNNALQVDITK